MDKVLFYRSVLGWFVLLERLNYKTRTEYRLRVWQPNEYYGADYRAKKRLGKKMLDDAYRILAEEDMEQEQDRISS